jgi:hypothetical protein
MTKQTLLSWCDQQVKDGKELKIVWDGGGDSGWVHFEIDGDSYDDEHTEKLVDYMYNQLDYGSWAGEFNASGDAIYDVEEQAFVGTDYYSETATLSQEVNIQVSIPKTLWFNELGIHIEANYDETPDLEVSFGIRNGFLTPEHNQIEEYLKQTLSEKIQQAVSDWEAHTGHELESLWDDVTLRFEDFKVVGDQLVGEIKHIDFRYPEGHDKEIYLNLKTIEIEDED